MKADQPAFAQRNANALQKSQHEIPLGAWHAVIISPAIDHRQLPAPVAMRRRGLGCLPLQRGGVPGITTGKFTFEQAPYQIE